LTGANALDIAKIGIDGGLLTINATQIGDAFDHIHSQIIIQNATTADGIRPDGSFGEPNVLSQGSFLSAESRAAQWINV
jgi:hypothetical protein